jgi:hypothetical protein
MGWFWLIQKISSWVLPYQVLSQHFTPIGTYKNKGIYKISYPRLVKWAIAPALPDQKLQLTPARI